MTFDEEVESRIASARKWQKGPLDPRSLVPGSVVTLVFADGGVRSYSYRGPLGGVSTSDPDFNKVYAWRYTNG